MYINTISTHHRFSNNLSCKVITTLVKICLFQSVLLSWTQICSTYFVLFVFTPGFTCRSVGREKEVIQNVNETICVWCTVFSQSSFFWRLCFFHLYFRFVSEENVLMSHLDIYSLNVYFRGPLWEKKKHVKNALSFSCDCGYHGNPQANTGVSIYSVVSKTHIVLIRKIV